MNDPQHLDPSVNRVELARKLRIARKNSKVTQTKAAENLHWSISKLIRMESGRVSISVADLQAMARLYQITDESELAELEQAALHSRGTNWWSKYNDVIDPRFAQYLGFEAGAEALSLYHPVVIPGQFQTEAYARALLTPFELPTEKLDRLVALRVERAVRLFDPRVDTRISMVLDEAALRRRIGSTVDMAEQLAHILELAKNRRVEIAVLPLDAGAHYSTVGPFVLLNFPGGATDLIWVETTGGVLTSRHDLDLLEKYQLCLADIKARSLTGDDALDAIAAVERDFRSH